MYGKHCFYVYIFVCEKADSLSTTTSFKIMVEFMRVVFTGILLPLAIQTVAAVFV